MAMRDWTNAYMHVLDFPIYYLYTYYNYVATYIIYIYVCIRRWQGLASYSY